MAMLCFVFCFNNFFSCFYFLFFIIFCGFVLVSFLGEKRKVLCSEKKGDEIRRCYMKKGE
jgi:hypothetical protein